MERQKEGEREEREERKKKEKEKNLLKWQVLYFTTFVFEMGVVLLCRPGWP
jgi:hypothetical protein